MPDAQLCEQCRMCSALVAKAGETIAPDYLCLWASFRKGGNPMPQSMRPDRCGGVLSAMKDNKTLALHVQAHRRHVLENYQNGMMRFVMALARNSEFALLLVAGKWTKHIPSPNQINAMKVAMFQPNMATAASAWRSEQKKVEKK